MDSNMTATTAAADAIGSVPDLPKAEDIRALIERREKAKLAEESERHRRLEDELRHQKEMFLDRKLTPEFINLVIKRVRDAAENGASEIMLGQFPAAWCTDGGRKINVPEPDWPDTLQGFAKQFYQFWEHDLRPKGFRLRAEIVSFPNGMPGDVGAFLAW
jgi:hypothetical protein